MPINPPTTTLAAIQTKVRRLTRSMSTAQLSEDDLNNYINTFVVYDFPEHLRMFNLKTTFTFYTNPGQDEYSTDIISFGGNTTNPLYDFQNRYISVHDPLYIAGYQSLFTQSQEQFFGIYPKVNSIAATGQFGDGITTLFTGVINTAQTIIGPVNQFISLLQENVLIDSIGTNGIGLSMVDVPVVDPVTGYKTQIGNLYDPSNLPAVPPTVVNPASNINYLTGVFAVTFSAAPAASAPINSQTVPQVLSLPQAMMFYDNKFTVRPVPDQPYRINFDAYIRPVALLDTAQSPTLNEWWQYISYGAAKKIFEDRMDLDSVALILPEYRKQETLCLRRTIVQNTNERVATIYTDQVGGPSYNGWGWNGSQF